jgi:hypothetical protein
VIPHQFQCIRYQALATLHLGTIWLYLVLLWSARATYEKFNRKRKKLTQFVDVKLRTTNLNNLGIVQKKKKSLTKQRKYEIVKALKVNVLFPANPSSVKPPSSAIILDAGKYIEMISLCGYREVS